MFAGICASEMMGLASSASCGVDVSYEGVGGFPVTRLVTLGAGYGLVDLNFVTSGVPDKIEVWLGGVKVIDTGYVGDTSYQASLDAELILRGEPTEIITQRTGAGTTLDEDWENPALRDNAQFYKSVTNTTATARIFSPIGGAWKFSLACPDNELQLTFIDELADYENLTLTGALGSLSITG